MDGRRFDGKGGMVKGGMGKGGGDRDRLERTEARKYWTKGEGREGNRGRREGVDWKGRGRDWKGRARDGGRDGGGMRVDWKVRGEGKGESGWIEKGKYPLNLVKFNGQIKYYRSDCKMD